MEAERLERHPARPAAVAAVLAPHTVLARAGGRLGGCYATGVCPLFIPLGIPCPWECISEGGFRSW
jgi:hypothetical protein